MVSLSANKERFIEDFKEKCEKAGGDFSVMPVSGFEDIITCETDEDRIYVETEKNWAEVSTSLSLLPKIGEEHARGLINDPSEVYVLKGPYGIKLGVRNKDDDKVEMKGRTACELALERLKDKLKIER